MTTTNRSTSDSNLQKIPAVKDNFGLTKSEFDAYVIKLSQGDESLFTKVFSAHFHDSVAYIRLKFNINNEVAYDTCMDTMLEFRRKIIASKIQYGNLRYLFTRMALNNYIDEAKKSKKTDTAIDVFLDDYNLDTMEREHFFDVIDRVLEQQDNDSKKLIDEIFYIGKSVNQMADESGVSNATVRKRKQRVISKLKLTFFEILKSEK